MTTTGPATLMDGSGPSRQILTQVTERASAFAHPQALRGGQGRRGNISPARRLIVA